MLKRLYAKTKTRFIHDYQLTIFIVQSAYLNSGIFGLLNQLRTE